MSTTIDLSGKVALITGGSRGLGLAMAHGLAEAGADIIVVSRKLEACEAAAAEIRALGRKAKALACHVGKWGEVDALVEAAYAAFGKVDVLINNAGMSPVAPSVVDITEELFDKVIAVNFKGPFRLAALVGDRMQKGNGGSIINISSTGSIRPQPNSAPYGAAKAALNAVTIALSRGFGPQVRVNAILAGPFDTDIAKAWTPEQRERYIKSMGSAMQRIGRPEEVVGAALYLASDASSFTTGALLRVDGGLP